MRKFVLLLFCCPAFLLRAQLPKDFVIPVKVIVDDLQSSISFQWPVNPAAVSYTIKRKVVTDFSYSAAFNTIGNINSNAPTTSAFTDADVTAGISYEYEISGSFAGSLPSNRSSYICAGINILPVHKRGTMVLLCESNIAAELQNEISRLYSDLVADGWKVVRINAARSDNPDAVKAVKRDIVNAYAANPDLEQVLIVGHVPVPYSGDINPDGHSEHIGSWPADGYYGVIEGDWTDTITSHSIAGARPQTKNFPGDGKFDQNELPPVRLAVGRIDFDNLPAFGIPETQLTSKYLNKNHLYRTGATQINKQALVEDNFPSFTEKFSQSAWKSYAATVGYDNVLTGQYETDLLASVGYLWSYGSGAGTYTAASSIISTTDFVSNAYKTVFTQLFGSYFGDWDSQDNLMRASIASAGNTLTCVWGGRPHWYFHHMSTGLPIGYSALLTMNNNGLYANTGSSNAMVHIGLMGDPTLRSSYVKAVTNMAATLDTTSVTVHWRAPAESNITGYYIYRSNSITGDFILLNNYPLADTSFTDLAPLSGNNVYMVRTLKMDTVIRTGNYSNNSTYNNLAQGSFDSVFYNNAVSNPTISLKLLAQLGPAAEPKQVAILGNFNKRYFVGEKNGDVKLYDSAFHLTGTYLSAPGINEGFLSLAFHRDFERNKLLYVFYTNSNGDLELTRFKENNNGNTASASGVMLTIPNPGESRNLGGEINFGPDGNMYISTGDGDTKDAALGNAQNNSSLLGKILRISPDTLDNEPYYQIPADNPFGNEVFAKGLRFPYRWSFDRISKSVWIGERGDSSLEEINQLAINALNGANFGWPCYDGSTAFNNSHCDGPSAYHFPSYEYPSPGRGSSVTGGNVYRGETFIALKGYYVFADANNGNIYLSKYDSTLRTYVTSTQLLSPGAISDISEDRNGELYATSLLGGIYRIEASGPKAYRFSGSGNWNNADNWSNKTIPPSVLPTGSEIIISPANGGECILNAAQTVSPGGKIIVEDNQRFRIQGNLIIQ